MAKLLGIRYASTYHRYENGRVPDLETLMDWSHVLGVPLSVFQGEAASDSDRVPPRGGISEKAHRRGPHLVPMRDIPVISWAHAGESIDFEALPESWQEKTWTTCSDPKAFALVLVGDCMEPRYAAGDVVVLMPSFRPRNGCLVVAKLKDDGVVFRRFAILDADASRFRLIPANSLYPPLDLAEEDVQWMYPVHSVTRQEW